MKVIVIGIGLIGGSFARDLRKISPKAEILGKDRDQTHMDRALELGLVDREASDADLKSADVVLVTIPVNSLAAELPSILDEVGEQTLVFDAGSTKAQICEAVREHPSGYRNAPLTSFGNSECGYGI